MTLQPIQGRYIYQHLSFSGIAICRSFEAHNLNSTGHFTIYEQHNFFFQVLLYSIEFMNSTYFSQVYWVYFSQRVCSPQSFYKMAQLKDWLKDSINLASKLIEKGLLICFQSICLPELGSQSSRKVNSPFWRDTRGQYCLLCRGSNPSFAEIKPHFSVSNFGPWPTWHQPLWKDLYSAS